MIKLIFDNFIKYEFVYIFFIAGLFFLTFSIFRKKQFFRISGLIFFSFFISLAAAEFYLSFGIDIYADSLDKNLFQLDRHNVETHHIKVILAKDKKRKYYENRELKSGEILISEADYSVYSNGVRYTKGNKESLKNYVFLGCSFTFGETLNNNQTLPYYFSENMNFDNNVLNFGRKAKGLATALNILESGVLNQFINQNGKTEYVIYSFIGDHIRRSFKISSSDWTNDTLIYKENRTQRIKQPYGILKTIFMRSYIFNKFFLSLIDNGNKEYYENYTVNILSEIKDIVENKYKSKFILLMWPDKKGANWYDYGNLLKKIKEKDFDIVYLPEELNKYDEYMIKYDTHPNEKANKKIADILMRHINLLENPEPVKE